MKALVTGGGGFLGKAIVERLRARGDHVQSFSRGDYPELRALGVPLFQGDLDRRRCRCCVRPRGATSFFTSPPSRASGGRIRISSHQRRRHRKRPGRVPATRHRPPCLHQHAERRLRRQGPGRHRRIGPVSRRIITLTIRGRRPRPNGWCSRPMTARLATVALRPHLIWGPGDHHLIPRILARARAGPVAAHRHARQPGR